MARERRFDPVRRRLGAALALGGLSALGALPGPARAGAEAGARRAGEVCAIVGPWEIAGLDPSRDSQLFTRMEIVETLFNAADDGSPLPGLAARWSVSADGLRWRLALRPGARFHDGAPVRAEDVVLALRHARPKPGVLGLVPIEDLAAEEGAVTIRLARPFAALPAVLAHSSTQILAPSCYDAAGTVHAIVGSGPYRISVLQPPQRMEVVRFEDWDGPPPAIERASYLSVGRAETRALMAEGGQADLAFGLDPASVQRLRRHPTLHVESVVIPRTIFMKLNVGHRWLADRRAREAISLALLRGGIAHAILRDRTLAATQLFPPGLAGWHVPALAPLAGDLERARGLLAELGWRRGEDGILERPGVSGSERFTLTLRTFPDRPELPLIAAAAQEQLRQLGVAVSVAIGNSSDIPAGHRDGTLELALGARNFAVVPDPLVTLMQDFGPDGGDWGAMGWTSPALQQAVAELQAGTGGAERRQLQAEIAGILQRELPVIPVAWYRLSVAVNPRIAGASVDPLERSYRLGRMRWSA